ncbi:MAG: dolichyl-phosphate beta-glucosyltransferase [Chloroflexota bacterium]
MTRLSASPGVSIIIPAYNEEQRLPRTLGELDRYRRQFDGDFEVIVADDGSSDGTAALVDRKALTAPWLHLLKRPHRGKGAAVRAGMMAAQQPRVILCDADLSMPLSQLDRFLEIMDRGCQVVIGSRVLPQSKRYQNPIHRRLMSWGFNLLVRIMLVPGVHDTQCGFKAFQRDVARDLFGRQYLNGFTFDVEILYLARRQGYRMLEVPIDWYFDADSRVRAGVDAVLMTLDLFRIRLRALLRRYGQPLFSAEGERLPAPENVGRLGRAWHTTVGMSVVLARIAFWLGLLPVVMFGLFTAPLVMACAFLVGYILFSYVRHSYMRSSEA